jgi:hypothetical protein
VAYLTPFVPLSDQIISWVYSKVAGRRGGIFYKEGASPPQSSLFYLSLHPKRSSLRRGALAPLKISSPSQTDGKRALKKDLFERGLGGEHLIATKTKQDHDI